MSETNLRGTTIIAIKKGDQTVIAGDGQVTLGEKFIMKATAVKVRRIYNDSVVVGFAGNLADAFNLSEKFEKMLNKFNGNLMRSAVELALLWRRDKASRNLDAMMLVADKNQILLIDGVGNVMEPEDNIIAIGSGGFYALSAARALAENTDLTAKEIAIKSLKIASSICVFTNTNIVVEEV